MVTETLAGGWSNWNFTIPANVKKKFDDTLGKLVGVRYYDLFAYKEQIVNGTNYRFICAAESVLAFPERIYLVEAQVYAPLKGEPVVVRIHEIGPVPNTIPGGWQNWRFPASQQAANALSKVIITGAKYTPFGSTSQIVAGVNYCLVCEQTFVIPNSPANAVLVYLSQAPDGTVHISAIHSIE